MPYFRPEKKPVIAILVKRAILFFFFLCALTAFLYGIGTAQEFMDRTQLLLLRLSVVFGLSLGVGSLYGIVLNCWLVFRDRKYRFFTGAGIYIVLGLFGAVIATLAAFIIVATGGNRA
ncbi:MAG: hypothetical protein LBU16_02490 [Treponema sp.]|jgi:hypothetical protein|nr:hypothetical protein [Treponema sp.]